MMLFSKTCQALLQTIVDDALDITEKEGHAVKHVAVLDHKLAAKRSEVPWKEGRDIWWQDVMDALPSECPVEWVDAEAPLFKVSTPVPSGTLSSCASSLMHICIDVVLEYHLSVCCLSHAKPGNSAILHEVLMTEDGT